MKRTFILLTSLLLLFAGTVFAGNSCCNSSSDCSSWESCGAGLCVGNFSGSCSGDKPETKPTFAPPTAIPPQKPPTQQPPTQPPQQPPTTGPGQPTTIQPTDSETPECPKPDCDTNIIGTCSDGSPLFERTCDWGRCGRASDKFCGSTSKDEYAPIWVRVNSVENGKTISWKGSQSKDPVKGSSWSVDPLNSEGYFQNYKASYAGSVETFYRDINKIDATGQMNVWIDDDYGNYEYWSNHFCGQGLAYGETSGRINGNPQQCGGKPDYTGAWCRLDPASCGGNLNCVKDYDGCVDFMGGGPVALSIGKGLTGYHENINLLLSRLNQGFDGRWAASFWTVQSVGGKYGDFNVDVNLIPPAGYKCVNAIGARVRKRDGGLGTASVGDFHRPVGNSSECEMELDPRSYGNMIVFEIEKDPQIPNCNITSISSTKVRAGDSVSISTTYTSEQGNVSGELFRGSADAPLSLWKGISGLTSVDPTQTTASNTTTWTPTYPATFELGCRAMNTISNNNVVECRPASITDSAVPYACFGPTTEQTVSVLPACPTGFTANVNAAGTEATLSWNKSQYATEYVIRANAEPEGDWRNLAAGDTGATVGDVSTVKIKVQPNKTYHWYVEPHKNVGDPANPSDACRASTFTTTPGAPTLTPAASPTPTTAGLTPIFTPTGTPTATPIPPDLEIKDVTRPNTGSSTGNYVIGFCNNKNAGDSTQKFIIQTKNLATNPVGLKNTNNVSVPSHVEPQGNYKDFNNILKNFTMNDIMSKVRKLMKQFMP